MERRGRTKQSSKNGNGTNLHGMIMIFRIYYIVLPVEDDNGNQMHALDIQNALGNPSDRNV